MAALAALVADLADLAMEWAVEAPEDESKSMSMVRLLPEMSLGLAALEWPWHLTPLLICPTFPVSQK